MVYKDNDDVYQENTMEKKVLENCIPKVHNSLLVIQNKTDGTASLLHNDLILTKESISQYSPSITLVLHKPLTNLSGEHSVGERFDLCQILSH